MKPTYEEVIEAMAIAAYNAMPLSISEIVRTDGRLVECQDRNLSWDEALEQAGGKEHCRYFIDMAAASLRALQDMMPEPEPRSNFGLSVAEKIDQVLADKGRIYNHFKTMGRNNETK